MNLRSFRLLPLAIALAALGSAAAAQSSVDLAAGTVRAGKLFDPARASYTPVQQAGYRIEARRTGSTLELAVTPPAGTAYVLALAPELAQLRQVLVAGDRLWAIGWMNGAGASDVSLYRAADGRLLDRFWAYQPLPSPDGRYVAFQKFHPSHFIDQWETQYRLYDAALAPAANRAALRTPLAGEPAGDALVDVGLALYPLAPGELDRDASDLTPASAHSAGSGFAWSTDSRRVAFVDVQGGRARLVSAALGTARPQVTAAPLPELGLLCAGAPEGRACTSLSPDFVSLALGRADATLTVQRPGTAARRIGVPAGRFTTVAP